MPIRPGAHPWSSDSDGSIGVLLLHGFTGSPASMRPEQYRRTRPEQDEPLLGGTGGELAKARRLSENRVELGGKGAAPTGVEPNLCAELRGLCPLFLLIFVEVAALGLPIAILPIITTTEFAQ